MSLSSKSGFGMIEEILATFRSGGAGVAGSTVHGEDDVPTVVGWKPLPLFGSGSARSTSSSRTRMGSRFMQAMRPASSTRCRFLITSFAGDAPLPPEGDNGEMPGVDIRPYDIRYPTTTLDKFLDTSYPLGAPRSLHLERHKMPQAMALVPGFQAEPEYHTLVQEFRQDSI
ncbi:unnamed protein product [Amoebophrya sp. A120]|nr:unnamed protein product [Amoebophrya sp. A120]|eukprot:GSA120T00024091001.1